MPQSRRDNPVSLYPPHVVDDRETWVRVILVYDLTRPETYNSARALLPFLRSIAPNLTLRNTPRGCGADEESDGGEQGRPGGRSEGYDGRGSQICTSE